LKFSDFTNYRKIASNSLGVSSKCLFFVGLLLLPFLGLFSQEQSLQFKYLTPDNGLSSSQVVSVLQDYKGYMWIGTYSGLNRYDGNNFVIYKNTPSDSTSILGNVAKAIFEDNKNRLFIGTFQGLSMYNRDLNCFVNFSLDKTSVLYKLNIPIFSIAGDTLGNLWLGASNGLFHFNSDNNTLVHYKNIPNNPNSISHDFIENVYLDSKSKLWISTHKGLNLLNTKTGLFENVSHFFTLNNSINNKYHTSAIEDRTGNMWFGTYDGLYCLDAKNSDGNNNFIHYNNNNLNASSLSHNYVISLYVYY
jgi:ligand-binding sensor domain-containing protein